MNILELKGKNIDKYFAIKFNYKYTPYNIKECIDSKHAKKGIKKQSLDLLENLYKGYANAYDDIVTEKNVIKIKNLVKS